MIPEVFDYSLPTYMLDMNYDFMFWNPAFNELIAKQIGLSPFAHAADFVNKMEDPQAVMQRASEVFSSAKPPYVDCEEFTLNLRDFGKTNFQKFAVKSWLEGAEEKIWVCQLNMNQSDQKDKFFEHMSASLAFESRWQAYTCAVLGNSDWSDTYYKLTSEAATEMKEAKHILICGAGAAMGIDVFEGKKLTCVEVNGEMVRNMFSQIDFEDCRYMSCSLDYTAALPAGSFDAIISFEAFGRTKDVKAACSEWRRLLKKGGRIALIGSVGGDEVLSECPVMADNLFAEPKHFLSELNLPEGSLKKREVFSALSGQL